jgi:hypothetical protein
MNDQLQIPAEDPYTVIDIPQHSIEEFRRSRKIANE